MTNKWQGGKGRPGKVGNSRETKRCYRDPSWKKIDFQGANIRRLRRYLNVIDKKTINRKIRFTIITNKCKSEFMHK